MKQTNLSPRQLQVLQALAQFHRSKHYSATIAELAAQLALSRTTAFGHIAALREKGLLTKASNKARSLKLTNSALQLLEQFDCEPQNEDIQLDGIPLIGSVAAGQPIDAIESNNAFSLATEFGHSDNIFALQVRGDSMIEDDIKNGDYVICKKTAFANNGQLAIVIVDDDTATLKRFYKEKSRARLQPANAEYDPIYTDNCRIEAIVVGLVRKF